MLQRGPRETLEEISEGTAAVACLQPIQVLPACLCCVPCRTRSSGGLGGHWGPWRERLVGPNNRQDGFDVKLDFTGIRCSRGHWVTPSSPPQVCTHTQTQTHTTMTNTLWTHTDPHKHLKPPPDMQRPMDTNAVSTRTLGHTGSPTTLTNVNLHTHPQDVHTRLDPCAHTQSQNSRQLRFHTLFLGPIFTAF